MTDKEYKARTHVCDKEQTLADIANYYFIPPEYLAEYNNFASTGMYPSYREGAEVKIPPIQDLLDKGYYREYTVTEGENLTSIAKANRIQKWQNLARINGLSGDEIIAGQILVIPTNPDNLSQALEVAQDRYEAFKEWRDNTPKPEKWKDLARLLGFARDDSQDKKGSKPKSPRVLILTHIDLPSYYDPDGELLPETPPQGTQATQDSEGRAAVLSLLRESGKAGQTEVFDTLEARVRALEDKRANVLNLLTNPTEPRDSANSAGDARSQSSEEAQTRVSAVRLLSPPNGPDIDLVAPLKERTASPQSADQPIRK